MARPREFDIEDAIERAMQLFWAEGYEGASLVDLLSAMGITRGSLYKAFEDKRSLYLEALARYDRTQVGAAVELLTDRSIDDGGERIARLMEDVVAAVAERGDRRGCFLCNAAVELAPHDPEVERRVKAMMRRFDRAFEVALRDAKGLGRRQGKELARLASSLTATYMGLRVLAKAGYTPGVLSATITAVLRRAGLTRLVD